MAASLRHEKRIQGLTANLKLLAQEKIIPWHRKLKSKQKFAIERIVNPILAVVGTLDDRYQSDPLVDIGCYVGVLETESRNFDVLVQLNNLLTNKTLQEGSGEYWEAQFIDTNHCDHPYVNKIPGYGYVVTDPNLTLTQGLLSKCNEEVYSSTCFENERYLSPVKVLRKFGGLVEEATEKLEKECFWEKLPTVFHVSVEVEAPAVVLKASLHGETFRISIVPTLRFAGCLKDVKTPRKNGWLTWERKRMIEENFYLIPNRPPPGEDLTRLWCVAYFINENQLAQSSDGKREETCRQVCELIMRLVYKDNAQDFQPLNPQIIRNVFLKLCHEFDEDYQWVPDNLGAAFVDLFQALIKHLTFASCRHFFLNQCDLLMGHEKRELKPVASHLRSILNNIVKHSADTKFLSFNLL